MGGYSNTAHPNPTRGASNRPPPEPTGEVIARFARPGSRGKPDAELRLTLDTYLGRPYLGLRLWEADRNGSWWPTKKGCSVRLNEAAGLADALAEATRAGEDPDHVREVFEHNKRVRKADHMGGSLAHPLAPHPAMGAADQGQGDRTIPPWEGPSAFDEFAGQQR